MIVCFCTVRAVKYGLFEWKAGLTYGTGTIYSIYNAVFYVFLYIKTHITDREVCEQHGQLE